MSLKQSVNPIPLQAELGTVKVTSGASRPFGAVIVAFNASFRLTQAKPVNCSARGRGLHLGEDQICLVWLDDVWRDMRSGRHELAISGNEAAGQWPKLLVVVKPSLNM